MALLDLHVNGRDHRLDLDPDKPLLWTLRDDLGLTGAKYGCGIGECGACTVLVDGVAVRSCMTSVSEAAGTRVLTIEGLFAKTEHPLRRAWLGEEVSQCGYCQPGQIMNAAELLARIPDPSSDDVRAAMSGNICRCGTYPRIEKAILRAAAEVRHE